MSPLEITIEFHAANLPEPIEAIVLYGNKEKKEEGWKRTEVNLTEFQLLRHIEKSRGKLCNTGCTDRNIRDPI